MGAEKKVVGFRAYRRAAMTVILAIFPYFLAADKRYFRHTMPFIASCVTSPVAAQCQPIISITAGRTTRLHFTSQASRLPSARNTIFVE